MNHLQLFILLIGTISRLYSINQINCYGRLRNMGLRYTLIENRKLYTIIKSIKKTTTKYYLKAFGTFCEGMEKYNSLSEDDKIFIEAIVSLTF